jgi:hypothetical protein
VEQLNISYETGADGVRRARLSDDALNYVLTFIKDTAAKVPADIAAAVQEGHDHVLRNIDGITDTQAAWKPAPDEWSIIETMAHIVTVKRVTVALTTHLGAGDMPPGFGTHLEKEESQDGVTLAKFETITEARESAQSAHDELLALINQIDGMNRDVRFKHFFFGPMNAREWACFQRIHDGDHFPQLENVRLSPGFPAS